MYLSQVNFSSFYLRQKNNIYFCSIIPYNNLNQVGLLKFQITSIIYLPEKWMGGKEPAKKIKIVT